MADIYSDDICELIRQDMQPRRVAWHLLGYRKGRKVYVTESTLRRASVEQLCDAPGLEPIRGRRKKKYAKKPPYVPLHWFWELLFSICRTLDYMWGGYKSH